MKKKYSQLFLLVLLPFISIACNISGLWALGAHEVDSVLLDAVSEENTGEELVEGQNSLIDEESGSAPIDNNSRWSIEQCNAMDIISVELYSIDERETIEDGRLLVTECDYTHQLINFGTQPVRIVYFKGIDAGINSEISEESGWMHVAPLQPGEKILLNSFITQPEESWFIQEDRPMYINIKYSFVAVYANSNCEWITKSGINKEIIKIKREDLLAAPCTLISPYGTDGFNTILGDLDKNLVSD